MLPVCQEYILFSNYPFSSPGLESVLGLGQGNKIPEPILNEIFTEEQLCSNKDYEGYCNFLASQIWWSKMAWNAIHGLPAESLRVSSSANAIFLMSHRRIFQILLVACSCKGMMNLSQNISAFMGIMKKERKGRK